MRGKSIAMLVLAMGCGLVASIGITQVIAKRRAAPPVATGETGEIFVAIKDIPFGEVLTSQLLGLEQWPEDKIPQGAITKLEDVKDRRARTNLYAGEPILQNKLFGKGEKGGGVSPMIEKGFRVVSVKVDSVSSSGDLIRPGDRVDVLVHVRDGRASPSGEPSTRTLLQHVKVFAVNDIVGSDSDDSIAAKTISLLVSPENAEKIMLASQLGQIQLVMRSPSDKEIVKTGGANIRGLFGDEPVPESTSLAAKDTQAVPPDYVAPEKTQAEQEPAEPEAPSETAVRSEPVDTLQPESHKMRLMLGPVVNVFILQPEDDPSKPAAEGGFWKITDADAAPGYAVTTNVDPTDDFSKSTEPDHAAEDQQGERRQKEIAKDND